MGPTKIFQNIPMAFLPILNAGQIYIYIYIYTYIHIHVQIREDTHTHMNIHLHIHIYTYTDTYTYTYTFTYNYIYIYIYTHINVHIDTYFLISTWIKYTSTIGKSTDTAFPNYATLPQFLRGETPGLQRTSFAHHICLILWFVLWSSTFSSLWPMTSPAWLTWNRRVIRAIRN